jgi:hypothetical protein
MAMTIIEAIAAKPKSVIFGYWLPRDGERVEDPAEIAEAIRTAGGLREVPWAAALPVLIALGDKPAPPIRIVLV